MSVGNGSMSRIPNTHGSRKPWRGTWGVLSDGRTRLSKLAKRIERELIDEFNPKTPHHCRLVRRAAILQALAEQTSATLGADPKSTRRCLTALERAADLKLAPLRSANNGHGQDLPALLAREETPR